MAQHAAKRELSRSRKNDGGTLPGAALMCPSCGHKTTGRFCSNCGEKEVSDYDYSIRHYLADAVAAIASFDSNVVRSTWLLLTRPGFLSSEYFRGSKVRYVKPLQLFLLFNVIYYFSLTLFPATTFTTPLATQLRMNNYYPAYAQLRVDQTVLKKRTSYDALEVQYNQKTSILSKTMIFLFIPIFAVLFYALFFRCRAYFVEHVVLSTHFWSFNLLLFGVILPAATLLFSRLFRVLNVSQAYATDDNIVSTILQVCLAVYLFLMLRRFYAATKWYCALTALSIGWSFFHLVWLYRFFLFELTLRLV